MESEISELTDRLSELKVRYRGVKRLMDNKNIHLIKGNRQNRLKINNYECKKVVEELHEVVKASQPFVNKTIDKVKKITNKS